MFGPDSSRAWSPRVTIFEPVNRIDAKLCVVLYPDKGTAEMVAKTQGGVVVELVAESLRDRNEFDEITVANAGSDMPRFFPVDLEY